MTEVTLNDMQMEMIDSSEVDYSDLSALFINCTLKRSTEQSRTQGLMDFSAEIMRRNGVEVENIRAIDHDIATGVWPDMTEHGWDTDEWPRIFERVLAADILVLGMPIWLDEKSSVCTQAHRAPLRQLPPAQRRRAVRLLRPGRRLSGHWQRGRDQALRP